MSFIPHCFIGSSKYSLRETREIFNTAQLNVPPEAQPQAPQGPEVQPQAPLNPENLDADAAQRANEKMTQAQQVSARQGMLLDQATKSVEDLIQVASGKPGENIADQNVETVEGNIIATEQMLTQMDIEAQAIPMPQEYANDNLQTLMQKVAPTNPSAAQKVDHFFRLLGAAENRVKDNPADLARFKQIEQHAQAVLQKYLALQLSPGVDDNKKKQKYLDAAKKAEDVANKIDLSQMTEKQMNRQIANLMSQYGVDVVQEGNKLRVIAATDGLSYWINRLMGLWMLITSVTEKETGKKAYEAPKEPDQKPQSPETTPDAMLKNMESLVKQIDENIQKSNEGEAKKLLDTLNASAATYLENDKDSRTMQMFELQRSSEQYAFKNKENTYKLSFDGLRFNLDKVAVESKDEKKEAPAKEEARPEANPQEEFKLAEKRDRIAEQYNDRLAAAKVANMILPDQNGQKGGDFLMRNGGDVAVYLVQVLGNSLKARNEYGFFLNKEGALCDEYGAEIYPDFKWDIAKKPHRILETLRATDKMSDVTKAKVQKMNDESNAYKAEHILSEGEARDNLASLTKLMDNIRTGLKEGKIVDAYVNDANALITGLNRKTDDLDRSAMIRTAMGNISDIPSGNVTFRLVYDEKTSHLSVMAVMKS